MDISLIESTTNVCIFGLGIGLFALVVYKTGSFIERKFDEDDRLKERERNEQGIHARSVI